MRISKISSLVVILLFGIFRQSAVSQSTILAIPQTAIQEDPNLNPDWDWRIGDYPNNIYPFAQYKIYAQNSAGAIVEDPIDAPTAQADAWSGLLDNLKDDGWVLLLKDFGTPTRYVKVLHGGTPPIRPPHFVLYNRYRSLLRIFVNVQTPGNWTKGFIDLQFKDPTNTIKTPAVLAHLKSVAEAVDKLKNMKDNVSSVFSEECRQGLWLWADFPLSFDPTISPKADVDPPSFYFRIYGQQLSDIQLKGISTGASGDADFVNRFLTGATDGNGPFGMPNLKIPGVGLPNINLGNLNIKASGTSTDWFKFQNFFKDIPIKFPPISIGNPFKGLFDDFVNIKLANLSKVLPISLPGLDIGGLFDFFIGGGAKVQAPAQPAPTFIAMNLDLAGTITSTDKIHEIRVTIPSTRDEYWKPTLGAAVGIVRNEPVGIITLTKTPIVYKKQYYVTYPFGTPGAPVPQTITVPMIEFELADIPQISMNSSLNLDLKSCEITLIAPMIFKPTSPKLSEITQNYGLYKVVDKAITGLDQRNLVELESPSGSNSGDFKSMPVPLQYSKGRSLQLPLYNTDTSQVKLKIKAILHRKDDLNAQPVVFIATYNVDRVLKTDLPTNQPLPTLPPQNVICNIRTEGAVVSWDRNREKNIKYYSVERSINNGSYMQIGTTGDTVFTDAQVKKAVKPYEAGRQNVQVYYRVRALSEWTEEKQPPESGTVTRNQFSTYSNIANVYGSIQAWLDKQDVSPIVPESNSLSQNFPNPFNPATTIYYSVREEGVVTLKIYNSLGQEVATLLNERKEVGYHYAEWDASQFPSGVYYYRITNGAVTETKRMVLTK
ncbi:MAG: T9SS type A sorting domain-containing protein [Bacteroidota bacterium]